MPPRSREPSEDQLRECAREIRDGIPFHDVARERGISVKDLSDQLDGPDPDDADDPHTADRVVELRCTGLSQRDVAAHLNVSRRTVRQILKAAPAPVGMVGGRKGGHVERPVIAAPAPVLGEDAAETTIAADPLNTRVTTRVLQQAGSSPRTPPPAPPDPTPDPDPDPEHDDSLDEIWERIEAIERWQDGATRALNGVGTKIEGLTAQNAGTREAMVILDRRVEALFDVIPPKWLRRANERAMRRPR